MADFFIIGVISAGVGIYMGFKEGFGCDYIDIRPTPLPTPTPINNQDLLK